MDGDSDEPPDSRMASPTKRRTRVWRVRREADPLETYKKTSSGVDFVGSSPSRPKSPEEVPEDRFWPILDRAESCFDSPHAMYSRCRHVGLQAADPEDSGEPASRTLEFCRGNDDFRKSDSPMATPTKRRTRVWRGCGCANAVGHACFGLFF